MFTFKMQLKNANNLLFTQMQPAKHIQYTTYV